MLSSGFAYLLWLPCVIGVCGLHRFYARKPVTGVLWLLTLGLLGIGQFIDLFLIPGMIDRANLQGGSRRLRASRREGHGPEEDFKFE